MSKTNVFPPKNGAPNVTTPLPALTRQQVGRLKKPLALQATTAADVANELASKKTYSADFGKDAPPAKDVAEALRRAAAWQTEATRAQEWVQHAKTQKELAWDEALQLMGDLKIEFDHVVNRHPEIANGYPKINAFLSAGKAGAARAAVTRAKKAKGAKPSP